MKLKNILIVVKDIEKSRQFYHDLFGIDLVLDNDGNMILTEGLVLQDEIIWKSFLDRDIVSKSNSCELYFEEQDIEAFVEKLERLYPSIEYVTKRVCSVTLSIVPIAAVSYGFTPTRKTLTSNTSVVPTTRPIPVAPVKPAIM